MKQFLLTMTVIALCITATAQGILTYADQFQFHGKPKQVKVYYLYKDSDSLPDHYWVIDYDYKLQIRTFKAFRRGKGDIFREDYTLVQSIHPDSMSRQWLTGYPYQYGRTLVKQTITKLAGNITRIHRIYDGRREFNVNADGTIPETRLYDNKDSLTYTAFHTYSNNGKTIKTEITRADGVIQNTSVTTYDEHNNPVLFESLNHENAEFGIIKDLAVFKTEYTYDNFGNFTKSIETYNGELNHVVIREITY